MYPHRIRLRGPWEMQLPGASARRVRLPGNLRDIGSPGFAGQVHFTRKFGYPGRIDAFERVWLTFTGVEGFAEILLNGHSLGHGLSGAFEFEVSALLGSRNEVEAILQADADTCGLTGEVALEVRCAVYLQDVTAARADDGNLIVAGTIVGAWPDPLDLYLLVDGANVHYAALRAVGPSQDFRVTLPAHPTPKAIRVELVQGPLVWHRVDL